jgi:hypothetical protein
MKTIDIKRDLIALGIDPADYRVLKLLPLIYVAWADGKMEDVERDRIIELARSSFPIGASGAQVLYTWLAAPPSREYIQRGLTDLLGLARAPEELAVGLEELPTLLAYAEGIARSTARALDAPWAVTAEEEMALAEIALRLNVDNGRSWAALLRELDPPRPPHPGLVATPPRPPSQNSRPPPVPPRRPRVPPPPPRRANGPCR